MKYLPSVNDFSTNVRKFDVIIFVLLWSYSFRNMKKIFSVLFVLMITITNAQYAKINQILDELEARKGINQNLKKVDINNRQFMLIRDFEDHTERLFIKIKDNTATYIEVFDDKSTGNSTSNIFTGEFIRTNKNIISFRFDNLEGDKINVPLVINLLLTKRKDTIYLLNTLNKERWVENKKLHND